MRSFQREADKALSCVYTPSFACACVRADAVCTVEFATAVVPRTVITTSKRVAANAALQQ